MGVDRLLLSEILANCAAKELENLSDPIRNLSSPQVLWAICK